MQIYKILEYSEGQLSRINNSMAQTLDSIARATEMDYASLVSLSLVLQNYLK